MGKLKFYLDESVNVAVAGGLRRRGIEVETDAEFGNLGLPDEAQLAYAINNDLVIVTHDADFLTIAIDELNKRHFTENQGDPFAEMNFDYFCGNIEYDSGNHQVCLVVDGNKMSVSDLEKILSTHEGFQSEIRITEE